MIEFLHPWVLIALFVIPIIIWFFNKRSSSFEGTMRISSSSLLEGSFRKRGEFRYKIVLYLKIPLLLVSSLLFEWLRPVTVDKLYTLKLF